MGSRFRGIPKEGFRLINKLLRITLAVALLSFGTAVFAGTVPVPIANGGFETTEAELNALGDQGWELVAVSPTGKENSYTGYWFKREKSRS